MKKVKILFILYFSTLIFFILIGCQKASDNSQSNSKTNNIPQISTPQSYSKTENYTTQNSTTPKSITPNNDSKNVNTIIGTFSTPIIDKTPSRMSNMRITCGKINGYTIQPGVEFSFNKVVGEATKANGYKKAKVLDKYGNKKWDYGGGVCQISSTLYNAVSNAGLKVTERHSHKNEVGYIEIGEDAAISYGIGDFRFINIKSYPVKIVASVTSDKVIVSLEKSQ